MQQIGSPQLIVFSDKFRTLCIHRSLALTLANFHSMCTSNLDPEGYRHHESVEARSMDEFTLFFIGVWALLFRFG